MEKRRVPLRRARGIRALLSVSAGAFVALILLLASPPADAGAVQVACGAVVDPTCSGTASGGENQVAGLLGQAEEIEAKLARTSGDAGLLADLTRTRINIADTMITDGSGESKRRRGRSETAVRPGQPWPGRTT